MSRLSAQSCVLLAAAAIAFAACGSGTGGESAAPTAPSQSQSSSVPSAPATCFSFSPARPQVSSRAQSMAVQVQTTGACSWTATTSTSWITVRRTGSLYQSGNGSITLDIAQNQDQLFGGCQTNARTGRITVTEETTRVEGQLEILQQGATGPFQPPATSCSVGTLPYGTTIGDAITSSDCSTGIARAKYYTFQGLNNQRISISMNAGRFVSGGLQVPSLRLYGPGGGLIVAEGGNVVIDDPRISGRSLFCGGTFTVEVTSVPSTVFNPSGVGNYTLRLDSAN